MRATYKCGGKGRMGRAKSGICSSCHRKHPKGKKQKQAAIDRGWESCKSVAARRKKTGEVKAEDKRLTSRHEYKVCLTCGGKKVRHTVEKQHYCRRCGPTKRNKNAALSC